MAEQRAASEPPATAVQRTSGLSARGRGRARARRLPGPARPPDRVGARASSATTTTAAGWSPSQVVELERIPRSTDVLGAYVVELDEDGELIGYRRRRRYHRSQADED